MNFIRRWKNLVGNIGLVALGAVGLSACSDRWKEEVLLSDGRVIVVERETLRERGGDEWASNRSGAKPKEYRIWFKNPDAPEQMIEWRSTKSFDTWPEIPLLLDMEFGIPVVFSIVGIKAHCEMYSKYVFQNGTWTEKELSDKFEQNSTNLFIKNGTGFVSLKIKSQSSSEAGYRKTIKQIGPFRQICW